MGKTALCIKMLQILNSGKLYKISELASMLETNPRNIIEYRNELEEAGYIIISTPGKYGGYKLDMTSVIPSIKLSEGEKGALAEGSGYILSRNDFMHKDDFRSAMAKIYSSLKHETEDDPTLFSRFPLAMPLEELQSRYDAIKDCIPQSERGKSKVILITYKSLSGEEKERRIHPYKLFMYNNAWFVLAFDEPSGEIRYFKLNRITAFMRTNDTFRKLLSFNESDYLDDFGMKNNGEWYEIKLKLTGNYATLVEERIYGKNQTVEQTPDGAVLTVSMQNKENIKVFVLGFGEHCKVLSPAWLQEEIRKTIAKMSRDDNNAE